MIPGVKQHQSERFQVSKAAYIYKKDHTHTHTHTHTAKNTRQTTGTAAGTERAPARNRAGNTRCERTRVWGRREIKGGNPRGRICRFSCLRRNYRLPPLQLPPHATPDLTTLCLYDVILFCSNSSSMAHEGRWGTPRTVMGHIARIAAAYSPASIKLRFITASNDAGASSPRPRSRAA